MRLETLTTWHDTPGGGPPVAASCVGAAPLDVPSAELRVMEATGYGRVRGRNRNYLEFPPAPPDPLAGVRGVQSAYTGCSRCHLCSSRFQVVHHRGDVGAAVAFYGEGPGKDEDTLGLPFIGRSGKLQDAMCVAPGIDPERDIFWFNAVGCRPAKMGQKDRPPELGELIACSERSTTLFRSVRPRVIVCLGKVATRYFFNKPPPVWSWTKLTPSGAPDDWIMVGHAYHPAYLVRVIGSAPMYKEYAAQRTFYSMLHEHMTGITKVREWRFMPQFLFGAPDLSVAWHQEQVA